MQNNLYFQRLDTGEIAMFHANDLNAMNHAIIVLYAFMEVPFKFLTKDEYKKLSAKRMMTSRMQCLDPETGTYIGYLIEEKNEKFKK